MPAEGVNEQSGGHAGRLAGVVLIGAPLLEILAMAHHPSVHAHGAVAAVAQVSAMSHLAGVVHGVLIALMVLILLGLLELSVRRGLSRPLVRAGLATYGLGVIAMAAAALVSGFVAANVAQQPALTSASPETTLAFLSFAMLFNQAFARCGALLMSAGIVAWSLDLAHGTTAQRALGYFGIVSGIGCALALMAGVLHLDVAGMTAVTVIQAIWTVGAGTVLLRDSRGA